MFKMRFVIIAAAMAIALFGSVMSAFAGLASVGPTNATNRFPFWYQDKSTPAVALQLCSNSLDSYCLPDPPKESNAYAQQIGFQSTAYWWNATSLFSFTGGSAVLVFATEAAFTTSPDGTATLGYENAFNRLRIRIDVPVAGAYTVTHPFGTEVFNIGSVGAGNEIDVTEDVGCFAVPGTPCDFTQPLAAGSRITNFLVWDPAVAPAAPAGYVGNPAVAHKVTGSPTGNNFVRIQGPAGSNLDGKGGNTVTSDTFFVMGKNYSDKLESTPVSKNFGKLIGDGSASLSQTFTVKNAGTTTLTITGINLGGTNAAEFVLNLVTCSLSSIAANASCTFQANYAPPASSNGAKSATITITSTGPGGVPAPALTIPLSGSADSTPPSVSSTTPANASTGAAVNGSITATFNDTMDASTIIAANFTLSGPSGAVAGTVTPDSANNTAVFTPSASLEFSSQYTATITTGVKDSVGLAMAANKTWTFTTGAVPDTTRPTAASTSPQEGALGVAADSVITVTFSEPMSSSLINSSTFILSNLSSGTVSGVISYDPTTNTASFTPLAGLEANSAYRAVITTGAADLAGNTLLANFTLNFATVDSISPQVVLTTPLNAASNVAVNANVAVEFSEAMDSATLTASTFTLKTAAGDVAGSVAYNANTKIATLTPSASLSPNTAYTATITTGVKDKSGNPVVSNINVTFTTQDTVAPSVVAVSPASGSAGVSISGQISATFSEDMDLLTLTEATFTVSTAEAQVKGVVTYDETTKTAIFIPFEDLSYKTAYTAMVTANVKDPAGNALAADKIWTFTTETPVVLTVIRAGSGSGTITGSPEGIDCGSTCSFTYSVGAQVTLTASADISSHFSGWAGAGCSGENDCTVTLNEDTAVTALFGFLDPSQVTLQIVKTGNGTGSVTVSPSPLSACGTGCYVYKLDAAGNRKVTLIAKPDPGVKFVGWSGDYEGDSISMAVTMQSDTLIAASFGEPNILVSAEELEFGEVVKKKIKLMPLTITNDGDVALRIKGLTLTGNGAGMFRVLKASTGKPVSKARIEPGDSLEINVKFRPAVKGLRAVSLNIKSDDPHTPMEIVHITGMGTAPAKAKELSLSDENYLTVGEMEEMIALSVTLGTDLKSVPADDLAIRALMAELIITALEGEPDADYCAAGSPYADVYPDSPACKYIKRLYELGLTDGLNCLNGLNGSSGLNGLFYCPGAPVTREQLYETLEHVDKVNTEAAK